MGAGGAGRAAEVPILRARGYEAANRPRDHRPGQHDLGQPEAIHPFASWCHPIIWPRPLGRITMMTRKIGT